MVRAGVMPMELAAAISDVVLKGAGGFTLRRFLSMADTVPCIWPSTWAMTSCASFSTLKRDVAWPAVNASSPFAKSPVTTQ